MLPQYLDPESWEGWVKMREEMRKDSKGRIPFTDRSKLVALRKLDRWNDQGYDPNYILDEAVMNGWRGLFINASTPQVPQREQGTARYSASDKAFYAEMRKKNPGLEWPS